MVGIVVFKIMEISYVVIGVCLCRPLMRIPEKIQAYESL
jgi:hypothetical protein